MIPLIAAGVSFSPTFFAAASQPWSGVILAAAGEPVVRVSDEET